MDPAQLSSHLSNSCCVPGAYNGYNLMAANPFDRRPITNQRNPWCSNELILKDKALRCAARVQPLDILHSRATKLSHEEAKRQGIWH